MRLPSPFSARRSELEIKMTPMIDVVFLLLIFFLWTASFQISERTLPSNIAELSGTQPVNQNQPPPPAEDFDKVVVRIQQQADRITWRINDVTLADFQQVRTRLQTIGQIKRDVPVILHPDPNVALAAVINLYDLSRTLGFTQIQFAASPRSSRSHAP